MWVLFRVLTYRFESIFNEIACASFLAAGSGHLRPKSQTVRRSHGHNGQLCLAGCSNMSQMTCSALVQLCDKLSVLWLESLTLRKRGSLSPFNHLLVASCSFRWTRLTCFWVRRKPSVGHGYPTSTEWKLARVVVCKSGQMPIKKRPRGPVACSASVGPKGGHGDGVDELYDQIYVNNSDRNLLVSILVRLGSLQEEEGRHADRVGVHVAWEVNYGPAFCRRAICQT